MNTEIQEQMQQKDLASAGEARQVREVLKTDKVEAATESKAERNPVIRIDQYIPSKGEQAESFGHYQPVKDDNGNNTIQFNVPTETSNSVEDTSGTQRSPAVQKKPGTTGKPQVDSLTLSSDKLKTMGLKKKQKNLERQIRQASDPDSKQKLKQKLAQIKRDLKAAES